MKKILTVLAAAAVAVTAAAQTNYCGGDISLLPEYRNAGAQYRTHSGEPVTQLLPWLRQQGMNAMRVRLFVDPDNYSGSDKDPNACQSLEYITPLCQDIVDNGYALMLDFHYSDTWADPAKQWTPAAWADLSDEQLYQKIYDYTRSVLESLREKGVTPTFIQPGNEISYGMLWGAVGTPEGQLKKAFMGSDANWDRFGKLLGSAVKACREVCPDAAIVIHTERVAQKDVTTNFYDKMKSLNVDYDIIGLSYYPYFHGDMPVLDNILTTLENRYPDKRIMVVETGYPYKWAVPGTTIDLSGKWEYSDTGQDAFARDLVSTLGNHPKVTGLFWWWPEYNAYGTTLSGWYNAPLFDSLTGCATSALATVSRFADDSGIDDVTPSCDGAERWYDLCGNEVNEPSSPGIYIKRSSRSATKVIVK